MAKRGKINNSEYLLHIDKTCQIISEGINCVNVVQATNFTEKKETSFFFTLIDPLG